MWICNIICCLQLLERLSHGRSFDNTQPSHSIRDPNEGREHSEPGRNTEPAWWSRLIAKMKSRKVEREAEQDYEMNLHLRSSASGVMHHHTTTESRDETMYTHAELFAYLEVPNGVHSTIQSLARDLDAGPALAYRQAHRIE
jgi:hypothetical protein